VPDLEPIGRVLVVVGVAIAIVGAVLAFGLRIPFVGQLPGDIRIDRDGTTIFIPLGTMLVVSIVLSVVLSLLGRR
jgi:hypothetical protein